MQKIIFIETFGCPNVTVPHGNFGDLKKSKWLGMRKENKKMAKSNFLRMIGLKILLL